MKKIIIFFCGCLIATAMQAQVIHVPADFPTIQLGIYAAGPGDTVLVSDGTYFEQINFLGKKPLMVASHFIIDGDTNHINNTIIDASQAPNLDSASVVYMISGEDTSSVLCGFTVTGGKGTLTPYPSLEGGGVFLMNSSATFRNNRITGNTLDDSSVPGCLGVMGGGVSNYYMANTFTVFKNNVISDNTITTVNTEAGGGGLFIFGKSIIRNNTIQGNTCIQLTASTDNFVHSGGIGCYSDEYPVSEVVFQDNKIIGNSLIAENVAIIAGFGAGAFFKNTLLICSGNEFTGNKIMDPTIWGGGGINCENLANGSMVSGNVFRNNESTGYAGGMFIGWTQNYQIVENNYFFNNSAVSGGGICSYYSTVALQNNVYYRNSAVSTGGAINLQGQYANNYLKACIVNSSFSENSASIGGAINSFFDNPVIFNSVFWENTAEWGPEIQGNCQFIEIAYCNIDTNLVFNENHDILIGDGIINEDPLFTDTLLNISPVSPCIDAGIAEFYSHGNTWEAPCYDIAGIPRPQSGGFEIGAYEMMFVGISPVSDQHLAFSSYPNPTHGIVNFQFSTIDCQFVSLKLYDIHGREVAVVVDEKMTAGEHEVHYNSSGLSDGIYVYRLTILQASPSGQANDQRPTTASGKLVKY